MTVATAFPGRRDPFEDAWNQAGIGLSGPTPQPAGDPFEDAWNQATPDLIGATVPTLSEASTQPEFGSMLHPWTSPPMVDVDQPPPPTPKPFPKVSWEAPLGTVQEEQPALVRGLWSGLAEQNPQTMGEGLEALSYIVPAGGDVLRGVSKGLKTFKAGPEYQVKNQPFAEDPAAWTGEQLGLGVASTIPSLVSGAAGALIGSAAGPWTAFASSMAGAAVPAYLLNMGDLYASLKQEGMKEQEAARSAVVGALPITALDVWGMEGALGGVTRPIRKAVMDNLAKRILKQGVKGALFEGGTESLQQLIQEAQVAEQTGKKVDIGAVAQAGTVGAMTGGLMGAAGGVARPAIEPEMVPVTDETGRRDLRQPRVFTRKTPEPAITSAVTGQEAVSTKESDETITHPEAISLVRDIQARDLTPTVWLQEQFGKKNPGKLTRDELETARTLLTAMKPALEPAAWMQKTLEEEQPVDVTVAKARKQEQAQSTLDLLSRMGVSPEVLTRLPGAVRNQVADVGERYARGTRMRLQNKAFFEANDRLAEEVGLKLNVQTGGFEVVGEERLRDQMGMAKPAAPAPVEAPAPQPAAQVAPTKAPAVKPTEPAQPILPASTVAASATPVPGQARPIYEVTGTRSKRLTVTFPGGDRGPLEVQRELLAQQMHYGRNKGQWYGKATAESIGLAQRLAGEVEPTGPVEAAGVRPQLRPQAEVGLPLADFQGEDGGYYDVPQLKEVAIGQSVEGMYHGIPFSGKVREITTSTDPSEIRQRRIHIDLDNPIAPYGGAGQNSVIIRADKTFKGLKYEDIPEVGKLGLGPTDRPSFIARRLAGGLETAEQAVSSPEQPKYSLRHGEEQGQVTAGLLLSDLTDESSDVRYQAKPPEPTGPVFYSAVERAADKLPNRATPQQVLATIQKTPGVKQEELDYLDLPNWLQGQKTVDRAAVLDYVRAHNVQVKEVVYDEPAPNRDLDSVAQEMFGRPYDELSVVEAGKVQSKLFNPLNILPKFTNRTLPGAGPGSQRELLMMLSQKTQERGKIIQKTEGKRPWKVFIEGEKEHQASFATEQEARQFLQTYPTFTERLGQEFKGSHWDEPNVLAHIRFNDRTDADGKRVMFVEEVQSDWHQKGRAEGYQSDKLPEGLYPVQRSDGSWTVWEPHPSGGGVYYDFVSAPNATEAIRRYNESKGRVPDAPFKTTWPELAMKRALRWAAENGYDRIAWTTGEQQADRYDLSKHIGRLQWDEDTGRLTAWNPEDTRVVIEESRVNRAKLPDYVGKEVAEKLVNMDADEDGSRILAGLDLKVGGEGMKAFYDRMLPNFMNKYAKKWGARVGDTNIETDKGATLVHSLEITPAMRESVLQGQPQFALQPAGQSADRVGRLLTSVQQGLAGPWTWERQDTQQGDLMVGRHPAGHTIAVSVTDAIPLSQEAAAEAYPGVDLGATDVMGAFDPRAFQIKDEAGKVLVDGTGILYLSKQHAEATTPRHEIFHAVADLVLTPKEKVQLLKRYEGDTEGAKWEAAAQDYAQWTPEKPDTLLGKVYAWAKRIYEQLTGAPAATFRKIESGEVWNRPGIQPPTQAMAEQQGGQRQQQTKPQLAPGPSPSIGLTVPIRAQDTIETIGLKGLAAEARVHPSFDSFKNAWLLQLKHGLYWHVTDNPNFSVDIQRGPRDMSSMASGKEQPGSLMVTSDLPYWAASYDREGEGGSTRGYAAIIDMTQVPPKAWYQVNRGMGNEFFVRDPSLAKVVRVLPIDQALKLDERFQRVIPQSEDDLRRFYQRVVSSPTQVKSATGNRGTFSSTSPDIRYSLVSSIRKVLSPPTKYDPAQYPELAAAQQQRAESKALEAKYKGLVAKVTPGSFAESFFKNFQGATGKKLKVVEETWNDLASLELLANQVEKLTGQKLPGAVDPVEAAIRFRGARGLAEVMLESWGRLVAKAGETSGKMTPQELANLDLFLQAKGIIRREGILSQPERLQGRNITELNPGGVTAAEAQHQLDQLQDAVGEKAFKRMELAYQGIGKFWRVMLKYAKDAGLIGPTAYQNILHDQIEYGDYVGPFDIIEHAAQRMDQSTRLPRDLSVYSQDAVKMMEGTVKLNRSILEASTDKVYRTVQLAERNKVMQKIYALRGAAPQMQEIIRPLKKGSDAPQGFAPVSFFVAGKRIEFAVPEPVAAAIQGLSPGGMHWMFKAFLKSGNLLRLGATAYAPTFPIRNLFRDLGTQAVRTEDPIYPWSPSGLQALGNGLWTAAVAKDNRLYREWRKWGGAYSGRIAQFAPGKRVEKLTGMGQGWLGDVLDVLQAGEEATRLGVFEKSRQAQLQATGGKVPTSAMSATAALESRTGSIDFAQAGKLFRFLNAFAPFTNARMQGFRTVYLEGVSRHPLRAASFALGAGVAAAMLAAWNRDEYGDLLDDIPEYKRRDNWVLILGTFKDEEGNTKPLYTTIPKPDLLRPVAAMTEDFMTYLYTKKKDVWRSLMSTLGEVSPIDMVQEGHFAPVKAIAQFVPPVVRGAWEVGTNRAIYQDQYIVPPDVERGRLPKDQYRASTSMGARLLGNYLNWSPAKIDHLARAVGGEVGGLAMRLPELVMGAPPERRDLTGEVKVGPVPLKESWTYAPVVRGLLSSAAGQKKSQLYDLLTQVQQEQGSAAFVEKEKIRLALRNWPEMTQRMRGNFLRGLEPEEQKRFVQMAKQEVKGFGEGQGPYRLLRSFSVEDGARTEAIVRLMNDLYRRPEERAGLLQELGKRNLIDEQVLVQLVQALQEGRINPALRKAGP